MLSAGSKPGWAGRAVWGPRALWGLGGCPLPHGTSVLGPLGLPICHSPALGCKCISAICKRGLGGRRGQTGGIDKYAP